jgi:RNA-binding protein
MLTNKEKSYLRKKTNKLKANFQVGKDGVSTTQVDSILEYLEKHEVVKVSVLQNCLYEVKDIADVFAKNRIEVVQVIGRVIVLYKESKNNKTISLDNV